jgi:protein tyrosine phosphatase (PTP) superfamily phosphohydrolase (DUF442 family)
MNYFLISPFCMFFVSLSICSMESPVNIKPELQGIKNVSQISELQGIKNFSQISERLASSGMPSESDVTVLKNNGYKHIISLLPGNQKEERGQVNAVNLTFNQIPVAWGNPTLQDFKKFVSLMDRFGKNKVLVHCALNYRASAFSYLYQVTQNHENPEAAEKKLQTIWEPDGIWLDFMNMVKKHYQTNNNIKNK